MPLLILLATLSLLVAPQPDPARGGHGDSCSVRRVAAAAAPVGIGACSGVRPGAQVEIRIPGDDPSYCTMNFAFRGVDRRGRVSRFIGTAGHCALATALPTQHSAGERRWARGSGPIAYDGDGNRIGRVAYAILEGDYDFALIRLANGVPWSGRMCTFGGPTGINSSLTDATTYLEHHGYGVAFGDTVPGRTSVADGMPDRFHVYASGAASPGDSGGAVISSDGRAVGLIVTVGAHVGPQIRVGAVDAGVIGITRLAPVLARAEYVTRLDLTLMKASKR